MVLPESTHGRK